MTVADANEILLTIRELKILLVKSQDFENSAILRDMEKEFMDKRVEHADYILIRKIQETSENETPE